MAKTTPTEQPITRYQPDDKILAFLKSLYHFWGTELPENHVDTVWPYWNLMDFTPEGRPDIPTPPQNFRSVFLEKHFLNNE